MTQSTYKHVPDSLFDDYDPVTGKQFTRLRTNLNEAAKQHLTPNGLTGSINSTTFTTVFSFYLYVPDTQAGTTGAQTTRLVLDLLCSGTLNQNTWELRLIEGSNLGAATSFTHSSGADVLFHRVTFDWLATVGRKLIEVQARRTATPSNSITVTWEADPAVASAPPSDELTNELVGVG